MMPKLPEPEKYFVQTTDGFVIRYTPETARAIQEEAYKAGMAAAQTPPPWWPAVENILKEYGLNAMDFAADFKNAKDAADRIEALEAALRQAREALELGVENASQIAGEYHAAMAGYRQSRHDALDADVVMTQKALSAINDLLKD